MKLIVGLGNPGRKYEQTRHNVGFMVAAKVASLLRASPSKVRFEGEFAEGVSDGKIGVLWPHTFMNASGKSVRKACDFYKIAPENVLVICDDLNLVAGRLRIRRSGSAGGQKGLSDIIRHLGTEDVPRLRLGIDRPPPGWDTSGYVLGKFTKAEQETFEVSTTAAAKAAIDWATQGITEAMNRHNADPKAKRKKPKAAKPKASRAAPPQSDEPDLQGKPPAAESKPPES